LGGYDRGVSFHKLARGLRDSNVKTIILFAPSGVRIHKAVERSKRKTGTGKPHRFQRQIKKHPFLYFFANDMEQAVRLAYANTSKGKICLLSPSSPSFGIFQDFKDRGDQFRRYVRNFQN